MQYDGKAPSDEQNNMAEAGEAMNDVIYHDPQNMAGVFNPRLDDIRRKLQENDRKTSHPEQACELKCQLTPDENARLFENPFGYHWAGLQHTAATSSFDDLKREGKKLLDRLFDEAKTKIGR